MGRKVTRVEKNRTAPKKSWEFKGGKGWGYKDANAINGKDVYCFAVLVATSHHTFAKKNPIQIDRAVAQLGTL